MKIKQKSILILTCLIAGIVIMSFKTNDEAKSKWEPLLDKDLSKWEAFIGVPHYSLDLDGYEKGDSMHGTPLGLNNDPLNVYSIVDFEGEQALKVSGAIYGGLTTKESYENYHLSMEFKWGTKKYEPRLNSKRDSGILYHARDPHGAFWNVWMGSQELQIQEGDCGDYYAVGEAGINIKTSHKTEDGKKGRFFDPNGKDTHVKFGNQSRCRRIANYEKPNDEWNKIELVCIGSKAYHIVNGTVVMVLENPVAYNKDGSSYSLAKGKIQIQSEGAEVYYRDIKIKQVSKLPKAFAKQLE